jgi:hypothetical protein
MKLTKPDADTYVPDGRPLDEALARTTHLAVGAHQDDIEFMALHGIFACFGRADRGGSGRLFFAPPLYSLPKTKYTDLVTRTLRLRPETLGPRLETRHP